MVLSGSELEVFSRPRWIGASGLRVTEVPGIPAELDSGQMVMVRLHGR